MLLLLEIPPKLIHMFCSPSDLISLFFSLGSGGIATSRQLLDAAIEFQAAKDWEKASDLLERVSPRISQDPGPGWARDQRFGATLRLFFIEIIPASDPKQCVGGQQQKILYVSLPKRGAATNRRKIVYKTYVCVFCTLRISRSSAGVMSPIHVVASANMDPLHSTRSPSDSCPNIFVSQAPLQDPCLWNHVSASMCISGSSARSMLPDP